MGPTSWCNVGFSRGRQTTRYPRDKKKRARQSSPYSSIFSRFSPQPTPKSSCCVGGLSKSHLVPDRQPKAPQRRNICQSSRRERRQWSSSPEIMENSVSVSHSLDTHLSSGPPTRMEENKSTEENVTTVSFVNHAASAWHERRREWVGDQSKRTHRPSREPIISWCTTYEELLSNNQPFAQSIPLSEMVDFLVDIWHEEGLYD